MKETGPLLPGDIFACGPPPHAKRDMLSLSWQAFCYRFFTPWAVHAVVNHAVPLKTETGNNPFQLRLHGPPLVERPFSFFMLPSTRAADRDIINHDAAA